MGWVYSILILVALIVISPIFMLISMMLGTGEKKRERKIQDEEKELAERIEKAEKRTELLNHYKMRENNEHRLAHISGLKKYYTMEVDEAQKHEAKIRLLREIGKLRLEIAFAMQEKEQNWATHAGIADALAGPVAGIATATEIMQKNARIKAQNEYYLKQGIEESFQYEKLASEEEARSTPSSMEELSQKYVAIFSWSPITLLSQLSLSNPSVTIDDLTGSVKVEVHWKQDYRYRIICIDGALRAKLYTDDGQCAGCAYMVFPKQGTGTDDSGYLEGVCAKPKPSSSYSVKFEPADLWELAPKENESIARTEKLSMAKHQKIVKDLEANYLKELESTTPKS